MKKNWKKLKEKDFEKEIKSLRLKELEKLWTEIRYYERGIEWEEFKVVLDKRCAVEKEILKRRKKKWGVRERDPWGKELERKKKEGT